MNKEVESAVNSSVSYREILEEKGFYIATPVGTSMLPMIRERIDTVKLVKVTRKLRKYDIILYERKNHVFVLHRIVGIKKTKDDEKYILCGDNQVVLEKYVTKDMIIGVVEGFYQGENYKEITDKDYIRYYKKRVRSRKWRKLRVFIAKIYHKIFKKKQG